MYAQALIKRMAKQDKTLLRDGALFCSLAFGAYGYGHYRIYLKKQFQRSEAHYKLSQAVTNCTPWKQLYFTWWRMPEEEWTVYHRFRPYFIIGQLDYSKEVLIPRNKTINGKLVAGFDVINPFYCYEGGKISMGNALKMEGDPIKIDRAALIVKRGWVPAHYRDKISRPAEQNSRELVKLSGCFMPGKNVHDYKIPNNPDANEWNNLCLEDIGIYWDLPNFDESKYYYFHAVDFDGSNWTRRETSPVQIDSRDEIIDQFYNWRWKDSLHKQRFIPCFAISGLSMAVAALAM